MRMTDRDRRDWSLLIFIVPIGILLMIIAGWFALRAVPQWSLQAGMGSSLEIGAGDSQNGLRPLINPQILTPFSWLGSYLTPSGDDLFFIPFVVIQPSATPSATVVPATTETPPTQAITLAPPTVVTTPPPAGTSTATATSKPPDEEETPPVPTTCQDPSATNYGGPLPCEYPPPPPTTCQDQTATNYGGPLPCEYPPTGFPSTPDPSWTLVATVTPEIDLDAPDGSITQLISSTYVVLDVSSGPVYVSLTPDANYDIVFYEFINGSAVYLDHIIIGISNDQAGNSYYEVFNWGNDDPDTNTNVDVNILPPDTACTIQTECDNYEIPTSELYTDPPGYAGILIDVDNATSAPPPDTYNYIVMIAPTSGNATTDIDAIVVTEVPIPTPTP